MFHPVTYDTNGAMSIDEGTEVSPASNKVHEVASGSIQSSSRQDLHLERANWMWEQILHFDVEVCSEAYERLITLDPIELPRAEPLNSLVLHLVAAEYEHPPIHQSATGTRITYTFMANEWSA